MRHFWKGFQDSKTSPHLSFKKHVIILYWSPDTDKSNETKSRVSDLSLKYPSVAVKVINVVKDPLKPLKHKVLSAPTVLLLKDGREIERITSDDGATLLEQLFRKATR